MTAAYRPSHSSWKYNLLEPERAQISSNRQRDTRAPVYPSTGSFLAVKGMKYGYRQPQGEASEPFCRVREAQGTHGIAWCDVLPQTKLAQ